MKKLREEAEREHFQMLHKDLRLTEVCDQVTALTQERDSLRIANSQLSMEIQELQIQYEPGEFLFRYMKMYHLTPMTSFPELNIPACMVCQRPHQNLIILILKKNYSQKSHQNLPQFAS